MSIKEELLKIRKILSIINEEKLNYNNNHSNTTIDLDAKVNEFIKAGGSKDLKCYIGYFFRTNKNEKLDTISIQDVLLKQNNYTLEENQLHQKLVNIINNYINLEDVKKEEVKKITI